VAAVRHAAAALEEVMLEEAAMLVRARARWHGGGG
jgi:hypothetical protein